MGWEEMGWEMGGKGWDGIGGKEEEGRKGGRNQYMARYPLSDWECGNERVYKQFGS